MTAKLMTAKLMTINDREANDSFANDINNLLIQPIYFTSVPAKKIL